MSLPPLAAARPRALSVRTRALVAALTLLLAATGVPPAAGQPSDPDAELERVESERAGLARSLRDAEAAQAHLGRSLQVATARVDRLEAELAQAQDRADALAAEVAELEERAAAAREVMGERLRRLYMGQAVDDLVVVVAADSVRTVGLRSQYLAVLSRHDRADAEAAAALGTAAEARRTQLVKANTALDGIVAEAREARAALDRELAAAGAAADALRDEVAAREAAARQLRAAAAARRQAERARAAAARKAARAQAARKAALPEEADRRAAAASRSAARAAAGAVDAPSPAGDGGAVATAGPADTAGGAGGGSSGGSAGVGGGGMACPQAAPRSFTDTWGAPRSGGRTHQGTDIFGRMGGDVYAIADGRIEWANTGATSGLFLSLRGDDGHRYWYMHLSSFVARAGQRVRAGQLVARNGNTGNAAGMTPHIHFEYHPGGGGAVNPYPLLKRVCG